MYSITIMMGRLVEDPELRNTANDVSVCSFRIAVDRPYKKDGKNIADFFTVIAWREQSEFVSKYFKKGKPIVIQGHFETRNYTAQDGNKHYITELISERISFAGDNSGNGNKSPLPEPPPEHSVQSAQTYQSPSVNFEEMPTDDDLPF